MMGRTLTLNYRNLFVFKANWHLNAKIQEASTIQLYVFHLILHLCRPLPSKALQNYAIIQYITFKVTVKCLVCERPYECREILIKITIINKFLSSLISNNTIFVIKNLP